MGQFYKFRVMNKKYTRFATSAVAGGREQNVGPFYKSRVMNKNVM